MLSDALDSAFPACGCRVVYIWLVVLSQVMLLGLIFIRSSSSWWV